MILEEPFVFDSKLEFYANFIYLNSVLKKMKIDCIEMLLQIPDSDLATLDDGKFSLICYIQDLLVVKIFPVNIK